MPVRRLIAPALTLMIASACQPSLPQAPTPEVPTSLPDWIPGPPPGWVVVSVTPSPVVATPTDDWVPGPLPTPYTLGDQCDLTGSYRLQIDPNGTTFPFADEKLISPDGRFVLSRHGGMVTVQSAEGSPVTPTGSLGSASGLSDPVDLVETPAMPYFNYWSPDGTKLALLKSTDFYATGHDFEVVIADLSNGLDHVTFHPLPAVEASNPTIGSWSPYGDYLLIKYDGTLVSPTRMMVWAADTDTYAEIRLPNSIPTYLLPQEWSPDGEWLAFVWQGTSEGVGDAYWLTILSTRTDVQHTFQLGVGAYDQFYDASVMWSPDSRSVVLVGGGTLTRYEPGIPEPRQSIQLSDVWRGDHTEWSQRGPTAFPWVSWQADSQSMLIWRQPVVGKFQLDRWNAYGTELETLTVTSRRPFFPPEQGEHTAAPRLAIYTDGETKRIDLIDPNGENPIPLVENVDDAGDPDWSPDGKIVAAVWAHGKTDTRDVHLVWSDPLGGFHQLNTDYTDIQNLNWSPDSALLTFVGVHRDGTFAVEMLDVQTEARHVLLDGLTNVIYPRYADQDTFYTLRWRKPNGEQGYSGFNRDASPAFHIVLGGDVAYASELFLSPDRTLAAVKVRSSPEIFPRTESLHIIPTDGGPATVARSGLSGLGDPIWSPDSQFITFTQSVDNHLMTLDILDREGRDVWRAPNPVEGSYVWYGPLVWEECR
jgi:Tol biopolymer transport system component